MNATLTCHNCATTYECRADRADKSRFCSAICKQNANRKRVTKTCEVCGDSFTDTAKHSEYRRHCSRKCLGISQRDKVTIPCLVCSAPITKRPSEPRVLCSIKCRGIHMRHQLEFNCTMCGKTALMHRYEVGRAKYCSKHCMVKHRGQNEITDKVKAVLERLGIPFINELPTGPYFIDFFLTDRNVALEIDGHFHAKERDDRRDAYLSGLGIATVRIKARILRHKDITETILNHLADTS